MKILLVILCTLFLFGCTPNEGALPIADYGGNKSGKFCLVVKDKSKNSLLIWISKKTAKSLAARGGADWLV